MFCIVPVALAKFLESIKYAIPGNGVFDQYQYSDGSDSLASEREYAGKQVHNTQTEPGRKEKQVTHILENMVAGKSM